MIDAPWEEFWWNNITGAQVIISKVAAVLLENTMVVLQVPSDLPWRHSMRSAIHFAFQERTAFRDIVIESIDIVDDNQENIEPGRFVLRHFAPSTVSGGYREKSRVTIQEYIVQREVIKNRIIWVKGLSGENANQWVKFCRGFSPKSTTDGLFVLEVHGNHNISETKYLKVINFNDYVTSYDVQLFNSFVLDGKNMYFNNWKKYISTVAALVCDVDAEVSELLLRILDFRTEEPIEGIRRIAELPEFRRRGAESSFDHVLWLYRNDKLLEIQHRVWSAQVQVLFPIIEMERVSIIKEWEQTIKLVLNEHKVFQYGEVIEEPMDVELGTLCYMMRHRVETDLYQLYIPDESVRQRIKTLHDCRNLLAHASCCTPAQVTELLK